MDNRLAAIVDFHEFMEMGRSPAAKKNRFLAIWKPIAARYKDVPDAVCFEILNEPNNQLTPALGNSFFREAWAIIRQTNPRRTAIIGPARRNGVNFLKNLDERGAILKSEAAAAAKCAEDMKPRELVFDKPFLILLERREASTPYFALWVDNPELLTPWK